MSEQTELERLKEENQKLREALEGTQLAPTKLKTWYGAFTTIMDYRSSRVDDVDRMKKLRDLRAALEGSRP